MSLIISWFETDDLFQRVSILFLLACLFGFTTNLTQAFDGTYPTLIGFYLAARFYMGAYLGMIAWPVPMVRGTMITYVIVLLIGAALWIGSVHVSYPSQLILIFLAMAVEFAGPIATSMLPLLAPSFGKRLKRVIERAFEFTPAINIEQRTERTGAFVTLVFGYTVVAILYQSTVNGIDGFFGKGILGLTQAFCYNWIYFEIDGSNLQMHAIRRHKLTTLIWSMAHLPFIMSFVLGGGALARLVVATDSSSAHSSSLTTTYQDRSEREIPPGIRWFYCAGFGIALACIGVISITHIHKEIKGMRLKKHKRLFFRFSVAVVLICLPLAGWFNSIQLLGTVTGLVVFTLMIELWACSREGDSLCSRDKPCKYFGQSGRKELQAVVLHGKELDVSELGNSNRLKHGGVGLAPI